MQNPIQIMQMVGNIRNSQNPMAMMQYMFGNNPAFSRAMQMANGKNPDEIKKIVENLAKEKGMDMNQVQQMANMLGIKM